MNDRVQGVCMCVSACVDLEKVDKLSFAIPACVHRHVDFKDVLCYLSRAYEYS